MNTTPALQAFAFDSQAVRVFHKDDQPWFVAKDVCACLGIANHRDAIARLDDDERDGVGISDAIGRSQETTVINESGLYAIILRSQGAMTPGTPAHSFRKWVTAEVLPAIRKTGQYAAPGVVPAANEARLDKLIGLVEQMLTVIPQLVQQGQAAGPKRNRSRKPMHQRDADRILMLRGKGYKLQELVEETGFSRSQCWAVITDHYKVLENGMISIDLQSQSVKAADAAAKFERAHQSQRPLV